MQAKPQFKWIAICLAALAVLSGVWLLFRVWPRQLPARLEPALPRVFVKQGKLGLALPAQVLVAKVGEYSRILDAYLYFQFLQSQRAVTAGHVLMCSGPVASTRKLNLYLQVDPNILRSTPHLVSLVADGAFRNFALQPWTRSDLSSCRKGSKRLESAFRAPPTLRLHEIPDRRLIAPMADFLVFKSDTDIRVRSRRDPTLAPLTFPQARQLAEDILIVSRFYSLPLAYFLGIGAMENNYMSVRGDLGHAIWKRRPQPGDVVLARRRNRVLVRDDSLGVWQITRATLRYAQLLYLRSRQRRDYGLLPKRLRPKTRQDPDDIRPETLTTYAGLLFRHLLDHFDGNVRKAVGAYNGGAAKPNRAYADSVRRIALYARRVIYHAVEISMSGKQTAAQ